MSQWNRRDPLNRNQRTGRATAMRRAKGLGAAGTGAEHWWLQRLTAVALVPLAVWFLAALLSHAGNGLDGLREWLAEPLTVVLTALLLIALFHHLRLGLQVIAEDYVHADRPKFAIVAAIHGCCYLLMAAGIVAILMIALA